MCFFSIIQKRKYGQNRRTTKKEETASRLHCERAGSGAHHLSIRLMCPNILWARHASPSARRNTWPHFALVSAVDHRNQ